MDVCIHVYGSIPFVCGVAAENHQGRRYMRFCPCGRPVNYPIKFIYHGKLPYRCKYAHMRMHTACSTEYVGKRYAGMHARTHALTHTDARIYAHTRCTRTHTCMAHTDTRTPTHTHTHTRKGTHKHVLTN